MASQRDTSRQYRVDIDVQTTIVKGVGLGFTPSQIHKALEQMEQYHGRVPNLRTVQRIVRAYRTEPQLWHWSDYKSSDAHAILSVINAMADQRTGILGATYFRHPYYLLHGEDAEAPLFGKEEADWIVNISRASPGMDPLLLYWLAQSYALHDKMSTDKAGLDMFLAMAPWQNVESWERYIEAVDTNWVPPIGDDPLRLEQLMRLLALGPYVGQEPMWKETSSGQFSNIHALLEPVELEIKDQEDQP